MAEQQNGGTLNINQAIREATAQLSAAGIDSAAVDARLLMRYLLADPGTGPAAPRAAVDPGTLFMRAGDPAPSAYADWVARRAAREPLPVSYTHLTLPTILRSCRSRWSPYH